MERIKVIESNFLSVNSILYFEDSIFRYQKFGKPSPIKEIDISELSYVSKPRKAGRALMTEKGILVTLFFGLMTALIALLAVMFKDSVSKQKFTFVVESKAGKTFRGLASIDLAFSIQDAWMEEKSRRRTQESSVGQV